MLEPQYCEECECWHIAAKKHQKTQQANNPSSIDTFLEAKKDESKVELTDEEMIEKLEAKGYVVCTPDKWDIIKSKCLAYNAIREKVKEVENGIRA